MNRYRRPVLIGMIAGAAASPVLILGLGHPSLSILLGIVVGATYALNLRHTQLAYVDNLMTGGALGVPCWGLISVVALPLLSDQRPEWNAEQMRAHLSALVAWVLYGALLGVFTQALTALAERTRGPQSEAVPARNDRKRIVILGGGCGGMKTAECLEQQLRKNAAAAITLVSETNALLFTPMLAEVAGSTLEASHISTPLRSSLHRTEFIRGQVTAID